MPSLEDFIIDASKALKDYEGCDGHNFVRWSKSELKQYAMDGLGLLYSLYPRKFQSIQEIELQKGKLQELPEGYTTLVKVFGVQRDDGAIASIASSTNTRISDLFQHECAIGSGSMSASDYEITGYEIEELGDNIFYVEPPVPASEKPIKVKVLATKTPEVGDVTEIPSWARALVLEWVLYRAYSVDSESQYDRETSKTHYANYTSLLSGFIQAQILLESGATVNASS